MHRSRPNVWRNASSSWAVAAVLAVSQLASAQSRPSTRPAAAVVTPEAQWRAREMIEGYERVGRKDPKWDAAARDVLKLRVRMQGVPHGPTPTGDEDDEIYGAFKFARTAGCDDPLIVYTGAQNGAGFGRPITETAPMHFEAARSMASSGYHPYFKAYAMLRAAQVKMRFAKTVTGARQEAEALLAQATKHVTEAARNLTLPRSDVMAMFGALTEAAKSVNGESKAAWLRAYEPLVANHPDQSLLLAIQAQFATDYAWEARGGGYADTVTEEMAALFQERLATAAEAGEAAYRADPTNVEACLVMLTVELGQGKGIERFDQWFERALQINPDCWAAYNRKLTYLLPKWYGSVEAILELGREAARSGRWEAGIPLFLVEAHLAASKYTDSGIKGEPQSKYFFGNEEAWADIQSVYPEYLRRVPKSYYHRSRYAQLASWCGHPEVAKKQLESMGKRFSYSWFRNDARYRKFVERVDQQLAGAIPATPDILRLDEDGR